MYSTFLYPREPKFPRLGRNVALWSGAMLTGKWVHCIVLVLSDYYGKHVVQILRFILAPHLVAYNAILIQLSHRLLLYFNLI